MEICPSVFAASARRDDKPLAVLGVTDPQICVMLRARVRALRQAGWRVVVICSPGALLDELASEGAEVLAIPMRREVAPFSDLVSLFRLWRSVRRLRPDLAEFSTPKAGLLGTIAATLCRVPVRIYVLRGLRLDTTTGLKRALLKAAERVAAGCSHLVLCNSMSLRERALALRLARDAKLRVVARGSSNGVDADRFSPGPDRARSYFCIPHDVPVIGFVGRLTRDKGIPELIDAFEIVLMSFPNARLLLVGRFDDSADALDAELRARIETNPRITHTGFIPDTAPCYRAMDLLVLPTWREGFPNAVLEAAATGIPVVTTRATGARDSVVDGVTGILVQVGDAPAIAAAVIQLLADAERRAAMGLTARRWVMRDFDQQRVLGLTVALYYSLLSQAGRQSAAAVIADAIAPAD